MADLTKSQGQMLDWTLLDDTGTDNPFVATAIQTKNDELEVNLHIVVAHKDTEAAGSSNVTISVLVRVGADDEGWRKFMEFQAEAGTAVTEVINGASGQGQANPERIVVADTSDWDTGLSEWLFLLDGDNLVDSCLCLIEGWSDNAYYINAWNLVRAYHAANGGTTDALFNKVSQFTVQIPAGVQYFMVTFHNPHASATYAVRVDYSEVIDIV